MATTKALEQAEIDRLEAQVTASQRMASEEETDADRALGRKVLTGTPSPSGWRRSTRSTASPGNTPRANVSGGGGR
ncbi:hypothetical protein [Brachybacterium alimentarium]|uniref:hypothetical protein n=1 Tax=Brachybacterium alimentarium TaxID=47845 RepID=UPI003FD1CCAB